MKTELSKISKDLEQDKIDETEARTLLLGLLGVSGCFSSGESEDLEDAMEIFKLEEGREVDWTRPLDEMMISGMQVAISHIRNNR